MNSRIKELRAKFNLTQEDFANKIGLKRSTIGNIEAGNVALTERNITTICKTFNVNPIWLKTGEGNMLNGCEEDKELLKFVIDALANENDFVKKTFLTLARLDESEWAVIEKIINDLKK